MRTGILVMMMLAAGKLYAQNTNVTAPAASSISKIIYKVDTIHYNSGNYKVAPSAKVTQLLKAMEGFNIAADTMLTHQGQQVKFVRINGRHYAGMTVENVITKLPAGIVENIEVIDDYGKAAQVTGIKTGDPDKILNINIKKNSIVDLRSFGYRSAGHNHYDGMAHSNGMNSYKFDLDSIGSSRIGAHPLTNNIAYDKGYHIKRGNQIFDSDMPASFYTGRRRFDQDHIEDRTETDRVVSRQITRFLYDLDLQGREVDDYGDQIPHFIIKTAPSPVAPVKK